MTENVNVNTHLENARSETSPGIRRKALTYDKLKSYVLAKLGYPNVSIEIDEMQMGVFWEAVLDEYNKWLPIEKTGVITSTASSVTKYDLQALNKPFGRGLTYVNIISRDSYSYLRGGIFFGVPYPISWLPPDQYDLILRYIGSARKIFSAEPDWEWEEPILWLHCPASLGGGYAIAYKYSTDASTPEDIPPQDWKWVKDYFLCQVKEAVGEARGKFGGIPGPAGLSLRSADMITEAQTKMEKLEEELQMKSYSRVPPIGPGAR